MTRRRTRKLTTSPRTTMKTMTTTPTPRRSAKPPRRKPVPQRTCVGCRQVQGKRAMVRIVRTPDSGVVVDPTGKRAGRGAYLCLARSCWETALKGRLEHALKTTLTPVERDALRQYSQSLPIEVKSSEGPVEEARA